MTGGVTLVIGATGRNFAAGMSGGRAFVLDQTHDFPRRCNLEMVDLEPLRRRADIELVRDLLIQHAACTGSPVAMRLLKDWESAVAMFVTVMPIDYRRVLNEQDPASAAHDPVLMDQWRQDRYPEHFRTPHPHAGHERLMPVEVTRVSPLGFLDFQRELPHPETRPGAACTTTSRYTNRSPRTSFALRAPAAWTAAFRSAIKAVHSAT